MAVRLKHLVEVGLTTVLPRRLLARRLNGGTLVLAFHNVVGDQREAGLDRSLHLSFSSFTQLIDALAATHRFVPIDEVDAGPHPSGKPAVAITFDDAYRGAVLLALPELGRRAIPAMVFVVPGRLGADGMWWDTLSAGLGTGLGPAERRRALDEAAGDEEAVRALGQELGWRRTAVSSASALATREELETACRLPGIQLGSHTWSHPNLVRLEDERLQAELRSPIEWLADAFGDRFRPVLAYPYGLSDDRVEAAARKAGYRMAFRVAGGWTSRSDPAYRRPRLNVPAGLTPEGMRLRGMGLLCR